MARPVIGISSSFEYEKKYSFIKEGYYGAVLKAGGLPAVLPAIEDSGYLDEIMEKLDGIILAGGPDLDARLFGEYNMPFNGPICPIRDAMEMYIARAASKLDKPLLGICRGAQVINAAFGGTLYQDIASQAGDLKVLKHFQQAPAWYPIHDIYIEKETRLSSWLSSGAEGVNSFHHQAVKELAPGFIAAARSGDGIIEALESKENRFIVGIQWHPEAMWEKSPQMLNIFAGLVEVSAKKL